MPFERVVRKVLMAPRVSHERYLDLQPGPGCCGIQDVMDPTQVITFLLLMLQASRVSVFQRNRTEVCV